VARGGKKSNARKVACVALGRSIVSVVMNTTATTVIIAIVVVAVAIVTVVVAAVVIVSIIVAVVVIQAIDTALGESFMCFGTIPLLYEATCPHAPCTHHTLRIVERYICFCVFQLY
jgi:hypothetical protein